MKKQYEDLLKIELIRESKKPSKTGWNLKENLSKTIDIREQNVGIICGSFNELLCIDVDYKDNGFLEFQKYILLYGEPFTVKQKTPNGYHYIFKYSSSNPFNNEKIKKLGSNTKIRGCGIDIRGENAYFVSWPSIINGQYYEYINSFDNTELAEIPAGLLDWLLEGFDKNKHNNTIYDYRYYPTEETIEELLNILSQQHVDDYFLWLNITTVLKNLGMRELWDRWSKKSNKYNKKENMNKWDSCTLNTDVNYLISIIIKEGNIDIEKIYKTIEKCKIYNKLTKPILFKTLKMNQKYIYDENCKENQFTYEIYKNYKTIIIESGCGSGKTSNTFYHSKKYIEETNTRFKLKLLSLITRISLANQHIISYKNDNKQKIISYQDDNKNLYTDNIVCCINSLILYINFTDEQLKYLILYIDEVTNFLFSLIINNTMNLHLRIIKDILLRMIKYAHKVIVSDACISDGILELLNSRDDSEKIYIKNNNKRFKNTEAIKINNENTFFIKIREHCRKNEPFFFGSDSCKIVTDYYNEILKNVSLDERYKYILITADTNIKVNDASIELKDKFIFYSPSITIGLDFNINEKQDIFIYIGGNSISPQDSWQQTARIRNIKKLYYYCNTRERPAKYKSLDEVIKHYLTINDLKISNICGLNREELILDKYFLLFCYVKYIEDIYNTNILRHYEEILHENEFILSELGINDKIPKEKVEEMTDNSEDIKNELFNNYINGDSIEREQKKYDSLRKNIETLNLTNVENEILIKFKDYIINKKQLLLYFNIKNILVNDEIVNTKVDCLEIECPKEKCFNSLNHKLKILKELEKINNIDYLNVEYFNNKLIFENNITLNDELFNKIKELYETKMIKPHNIKTLGNLYRKMLIKICGKDILTNTKKVKGFLHYEININYLKNFIELDKCRNPNFYSSGYYKTCYHPNVIKLLNITNKL